MTYPSYKTIPELWLTSIPSHWDSRKIKYTFSERVEKGYPDEPMLVASQSMGVVPKDVYKYRTVEATKDLHNLKLVRIGDFVISLRSFQGGIEYAYYKGIISPAYTIMIPNEYITASYFRYLAKSRLFIELLQMCVTGIREGQNIDYSRLKNHLIPTPPLEEQKTISSFLDWQISRIDKYIKLIYGKPNIDPKVLENYPSSLIAHLTEYRTRLISDVVTGKLDVRDVVVPEYMVEEEIVDQAEDINEMEAY